MKRSSAWLFRSKKDDRRLAHLSEGAGADMVRGFDVTNSVPPGHQCGAEYGPLSDDRAC
jgi:hypothetical protein